MRDLDIRTALLAEMREKHSNEPDTLIMPELGLRRGAARVDIAVVNGTLHGFEIKSEHDTLARLSAQAEVYSQCLEFVTIVASPVHIDKIIACVPIWWEIRSVFQDVAKIRFVVEREGERNPRTASEFMAQLLWREEALEEITKLGLDKGFRGASREQLCLRLSYSLEPQELSDIVRRRLKNRGQVWREPALLTTGDDSLPPSAT